MKKLILITIFVFCSGGFALAQDVSLPRETAETALKALEENPILKAKIAELEKQNKALADAQRTPCTLAQERLKSDLIFWINEFKTADDLTKRQITKIIKQTRKTGERSVKTQCGVKDADISFADVLKVAAGIAPILILLR
jgi:hypothetical protein